MRSAEAYEELIRRAKETALLGSCGSLLGWDEQTYLPKGGVEHRGNQMALLAGLRHERATDPRIGELLSIVEGSEFAKDPLAVSAVNIRELRRVYDRLNRLPRSLVEELARTTTIAQQEWITSRKKSDYSLFRPWLEKILVLKRCEADELGFESERYDALLEEYEPGARSSEIARLFRQLRDDLIPLVGAIGEARKRPDPSILHRDYPVERQRIFCEEAAAAVGFDFHGGRLDVAAHPFCSGIGPGDTRLTTRFDANFFSESFFGTLHEVGHGLYDQGLDPEHFGTPMGEAVSLGIHESQSRLWENAVGRSLAFWRHFFPRARQMFPEALADVDLEEFHSAANHVEPSLIRVEADEVTYNLHVLVRFELERALLSGELSTHDLPHEWNERYRKYLGISPPRDAEGCLQDIHWSAGLVGYFPTYTLGNLNAAQLYAKAREDLPGMEEHFARGEFDDLLAWLRAKIHRQGQRYRSADLIAFATGSPPSHRALVDHLRSKAEQFYGV